MRTAKILSTDDLARFVKTHRKELGLSQEDLAGAANVGPRFVGDLERGKETCEIGKIIRLLTMLGIELEVRAPLESADD